MRLAGIILLSSGLASGQSPQRVERCDLFRDLPRWDGVMISVTGPIAVQPLSHEMGPWISGDECGTKIRVKGLDVPNGIVLQYPKNPKPLVLHTVDFDWDLASRVKLDQLIQQVDANTQRIHATVVGLFETRVPIESLVNFNDAHPEGRPVGFGHGSGMPAQILVKTITDMRIEKKPKSADRK